MILALTLASNLSHLILPNILMLMWLGKYLLFGSMLKKVEEKGSGRSFPYLHVYVGRFLIYNANTIELIS